jgi:hypothetical protein
MNHAVLKHLPMSYRELFFRKSKGKRGLAIKLARATIASPHDHEE